MKKTLLASAVFMALTAAGQCQAASDIIYEWNSSSVPEVSENEFSFDGDQITKDIWGVGVLSGATGTLNNLQLSITQQQANGSKNAGQLDAVLVNGGDVIFAGDVLKLEVVSDFKGTGANHLTAFNAQGSAAKVTLSAEKVTLSAISKATDGKAVYGLSVGGEVNVTSKVVDVYVESATERKGGNDGGYSEIMGIDVWGGTLNTSENTLLKVVGKSTAETTTFGDRSGASPIYGLKFEGGQGNIAGTIDANVSGVGADAIAVGVTNYFYNTSFGEQFNDVGARINNVKAVAHSETGKAAGIDTSYTAGKENTVILDVEGDMDLLATTKDGSAFAVNVTGDTTVNLEGNLVAKAEASGDGTAYSIMTDKGTLAVSGKTVALSGDVAVQNAGSLTFGSDEGSSVNVTGKVSVDQQSSLTLNKASVELAEGSTMTIDGSLESTEGQIILNDAAEGTLSIASLMDGSSLEAVASGNLNDKLGGDLDAFNSAITITNGAEGTTLVMKEGLVAGEKTAQLTEEGKIDETTVTEKTNSVMASSLEMAAAMPLAMNRILTNDVRKRMGDLRASKAASGAWARYDGGKLSGDSGLDSEFHTIQVGVDTVATPDAPRVGLAFSYTDGDMDYARSSSDMQGYSLAGYATWMADNGMFLDTVVRMAKFKNDMTVDGRLNGTMDSLAVSVSGETGWRFDLNDLFYVEPQAEVAYTYLNGDSFTLGEASYKVDGLDSLTGRLGFASGLKCPNNKGDVYLRASVVHEFLGDSKITGTASGSTGVVELDGKDTWVEYGLGANFNLTDTTYVWADVERTAGSVLDTDWRATVGVRHSF